MSLKEAPRPQSAPLPTAVHLSILPRSGADCTPGAPSPQTDDANTLRRWPNRWWRRAVGHFSRMGAPGYGDIVLGVLFIIGIVVKIIIREDREQGGKRVLTPLAGGQ